jgi:hypothetical protein
MGLFDKLKRVFATDHKEDAARRADTGIEGFWAAWSAHQPQIRAQVGKEMSADLVEIVRSAVRGIHPELDWEFGPGARAPHGFTVSGHGDAGLRLLAERWRRAAPPSDDFDYFVTRQAVARGDLMGMGLGLAGDKLEFSEVRVGLERIQNRRVVNVRIYHPVFAGLEEEGRVQASFLILDEPLGEDGVERWIGALDLLRRGSGRLP